MSYSGGTLVALGAKAHVLYSRMLKPEDYWILLKLESMEEIASYLKQTESYGDHLDAMLVGTAHRSTLQYAVHTATLNESASFMNYLSGDYRKFYVDMLGIGETVMLKNLFRAIHSKKGFDSRKQRKLFHIPGSKLPYDELTDCRDFGKLLELLSGTRYYGALKEPIAKMLAGENALFALEHAVDIVAETDLWNDIKNLPQRERKFIEPIFGVKIDMRNICHCARCRTYYGMDVSESLARMLPLRYKVSTSDLRRLMECADSDEAIKMLEGKFPLYARYFKDAFALKDNKIASENAVSKCCYSKALSAMKSGTPGFHTAIGYSVLKSFEIEDIIRITEDVRYDYDIRFAAQYLVRPLVDGGEPVWQ
ncbi:MAG: V-type ATPase subunit [Synergistes sp.]|nr:V-type ATPase subunit [Synergistes sp.]